MGFLRFCIRVGIGIVFAFCWSLIGVIIGINAPGSPQYSIYGFGIVGTFAIGLWIGGKWAKKWIPQK